MLSLFTCGAILPGVEFPHVPSASLTSSEGKWELAQLWIYWWDSPAWFGIIWDSLGALQPGERCSHGRTAVTKDKETARSAFTSGNISASWCTVGNRDPLSQGSVLLSDWMTRFYNAWDFKQVGIWIFFCFFSRNQHVSTWHRHLGCSGGWALWSTGAEMAENLPRWNSVLKKTTSNPTTCKSVWTDSSQVNHLNNFFLGFFCPALTPAGWSSQHWHRPMTSCFCNTYCSFLLCWPVNGRFSFLFFFA